MERHRRGKGKGKLLGSHQKCWIWGRNAVLETLVAGRWTILDLYLASSLPPAQIERCRGLGATRSTPVQVEAPEVLERLCHSSEHQGYLARMADFPYGDERGVLAHLPSVPFCVVLDGIQDPYNFGAIARSAEVFGVDAVFIGCAGQVGVTSMVARSSAGAVNRVPIVRVDELEALVDELSQRGLRVVAASEKAEETLITHDFVRPSAVIIGNEGAGVRPSLLQRCAARVRIPQVGKIGSLNAAVAASVFFYEVRRQRTAVSPPGWDGTGSSSG